MKEAVLSLYEGGDPAALPALTTVFELDPDKAVKRAAACGLANIPDTAVAPVLLSVLAATDRATRAHAILALGRLQARDAVPALLPLLDDHYARIVAADALVAIGDERALEPLKQAAARGPGWRRRRLRERVRKLEAALGLRQDVNDQQ